MLLKPLLAVSTVVAALFAAAAPGNAMTPLRPLTTETMATPAAFVCGRDDRGWHYMRGDRRYNCRPRRPFGLFWTWRDEGGRSGWYHRRDRIWYGVR